MCNSMVSIQVTLFDVNGKYRPISTIVQAESVEVYTANKSKYHVRAIQKMCAQRCKTWTSLKADGYQKMKARIYNKEKIQAENAELYERIKKERGWN